MKEGLKRQDHLTCSVMSRLFIGVSVCLYIFTGGLYAIYQHRGPLSGGNELQILSPV